MSAAGTAIQGFVRMMHIPLGYDPHHVMSVGIPVHDNTYTTLGERVNYFEQLREKIAALPDVVATGISTNATPPNNGWDQPFEFLGKGSPPEVNALAVLCEASTPNRGCSINPHSRQFQHHRSNAAAKL
jgi:hypothetical protein